MLLYGSKRRYTESARCRSWDQCVSWQGNKKELRRNHSPLVPLYLTVCPSELSSAHHTDRPLGWFPSCRLLRRIWPQPWIPSSIFYTFWADFSVYIYPGPTPYLSIEEAEPIQHLLTSANIGYPKTKNEVLAIVQQAVHKKRGVEAAESFNGKGWWNRFVQRWPKICLRKGDALATPSRHKNQHHPILRSSEEDARWQWSHGVSRQDLQHGWERTPTRSQTTEGSCLKRYNSGVRQCCRGCNPPNGHLRGSML